MKQRKTLKINAEKHLEIGGCDTVELARQYGTPLYVMDEDYIRSICKEFKAVLEKKYPDSMVCYASKAFSCRAIYRIVDSEGFGADVVSGGELATALQGGMSADKLFFHGNNKLPAELELAVTSGVGVIVIDNVFEIDTLDEICKAQGKRQNVMVRVNPGIDAHTHQFIQTTRVDSKFGFSISDGSALEIIRYIRTKSSNLNFVGIHCHIGSQIFEIKPFELAVEKMTDFIVKLKSEGIETEQLNMGGGYGITYTVIDKPFKPHEYLDAIIDKLKECVEAKKIKAPRLIVEPGRCIVGEAGITLYTVGAMKDIKGIKKYISVDGGMFDNPRYALYQAAYEAVLANRADEPAAETVTVAGKCCESGDMLVVDAKLPVAKNGDILAVLSTGAYNYSMASNYNRNPVPPVVMVKDGKSDFAVKPQTYEDVMSRDSIPKWL